MRLLIHGLNFAPELIGIGKYTGEMAKWLIARGHDVVVVTAPPYYPQWQVRPPYKRLRYQREELEKIRVRRCPLYVPTSPGGLKRVLHLVSFGLSSAPAMLREARRFRPDVVLTIMPTFTCAPFSLLAARLAGAKSWLHVQDLEIDAAFSMGLLRGKMMRRCAFALERSLLRRFSKVSTISPGMKNALAAKGVAENRLELFPNWVDTNTIFPVKDRTAARNSFDLPPDAFIALYSGNMNRKQGLSVLADVARDLLDEPNFLLLLAGDGPMRAPLKEASKDLSNVRFLPLQPLDRFNNLLNSADVHLMPQIPGASDLVLPSKLSGMFAAGGPVITVAQKGTSLWKEVDGRGVALETGGGAAIARAVRDLMRNKSMCKKLGAAARQRALSHWSRDQILGEFEAKVHDLSFDRPSRETT